MGNTWEVWGWVEQPDGELRRYDYISFYSGESFFGAVWAAIQMKRQGVGCVKVEWR